MLHCPRPGLICLILIRFHSFLLQTLAHIATFYSMRGHPCLQKLVMKLVNLQRSLDAEVKLEQLQKQVS